MSRAAGFGLVEVLVAMGILALVAAALLGLQASSLRATRSAAVARDLAVAAESEARLLSVLASPGPGCQVAPRWAAVEGCDRYELCHGAGCAVRLFRVVVRGPAGTTLTVVGAGPHEQALEGAPGAAPVEAP